jgi:hypothetical protein
MVLAGLDVIRIGVRRKRLVTLCISALWKVNGIQVFLGVCSLVLCRVGEVRSLLSLRITCEGSLLFRAIVGIQFLHGF